MVARPKRRSCDVKPDSAGMNYENVEIESGGVTLRGWLILQRRDGADVKADIVIMLHGWGGNASKMLDFGKILYGAGKHLLILNARNQGDSGSKGFSSGFTFYKDLEAGIDFLNVNGFGRIIDRNIVFGHSMGATAAIIAAVNDKRVSAGIICAAFSDPAEMIKRAFSWHKIPEFPFVRMFIKFFEIYNGSKIQDVTPLVQIKKLNL